jgi:hypothetical protein
MTPPYGTLVYSLLWTRLLSAGLLNLTFYADLACNVSTAFANIVVASSSNDSMTCSPTIINNNGTISQRWTTVGNATPAPPLSSTGAADQGDSDDMSIVSLALIGVAIVLVLVAAAVLGYFGYRAYQKRLAERQELLLPRGDLATGNYGRLA